LSSKSVSELTLSPKLIFNINDEFTPYSLTESTTTLEKYMNLEKK